MEHFLSFPRIRIACSHVDFLKLSMSYRSLNTETTDIARRRYTRCNNGGVVNEVYHLKPYQILWKYLQKCERDDHQIKQSAFWRLSCLLFESCFFLIWCAWLFFDTSLCVWKASAKMSAGSNAGGVLPPEVRMSYFFYLNNEFIKCRLMEALAWLY